MVYVTDSLRLSDDRDRFYDWIHPNQNIDEKSSEAIIDSIVGKLKGGSQV